MSSFGSFLLVGVSSFGSFLLVGVGGFRVILLVIVNSFGSFCWWLWVGLGSISLARFVGGCWWFVFLWWSVVLSRGGSFWLVPQLVAMSLKNTLLESS